MNNVIKKLTALTLALCACISLCACLSDNQTSGSNGYRGDSSSHFGDSSGQTGGQTSDTKTLTFVSINDIHGYVEQSNGVNGLSNTATAIDKMSTYYSSSVKNGDVRDDIVLFGNGDMFQGSAISNMSYGKSVIEAMNVMRFDAMSLGNHEFDWGLDKITAYFDGDETNGEANFPLVAANVYQKSQSKYIADISDDDNVVNGVIVEKEGVKVGLIGVIGPCENSILAARVEDYSFSQDYIVNRVTKIAKELKSDGAEIISLNIHYSGYYNNEFANITDGGEYLIDVLFNGHTHSKYKDAVERGDGTFLPVVQAGANNQAFGYVKISYNQTTDEKDVLSYGYKEITNKDTAYDAEVEKVLTDYRNNLIAELPVLAVSDVTVRSKSYLYDYVAKLMLTALGTDYAISNTGGIRSTGGITAGNAIKEDSFYEIIPFDNELFVVEMTGDGLYRYLTEDEKNKKLFYGVKAGNSNYKALEGDTSCYKIAIIDYVYTGTYFKPYKQYVKQETNTHVMIRDLLVEDARLCGEANARWSYNNAPRLGYML